MSKVLRAAGKQPDRHTLTDECASLERAEDNLIATVRRAERAESVLCLLRDAGHSAAVENARTALEVEASRKEEQE
jgi:hypothetical protein